MITFDCLAAAEHYVERHGTITKLVRSGDWRVKLGRLYFRASTRPLAVLEAAKHLVQAGVDNDVFRWLHSRSARRQRTRSTGRPRGA